jgi:hypothetical protein
MIKLTLPEHFLPFRLVITGRGRQMYNSLMLLAVEANGVVALRMMKLMRGGRSARCEAKPMVSGREPAQPRNVYTLATEAPQQMRFLLSKGSSRHE